MTWSQMRVFSTAARIAKLTDYQMQLSIAHNPYRKDHARLSRSIRQAIAAERTGREVQTGIPVAQLAAMLGGLKRVQVSREELMAKLQPRARR